MQTKMQKEAKALKKSFKSQSAMEYLMTYGWAILIIAVVLSVLFYLGVFNPLTFVPRQQAGSCQVMRPNGPRTNFDLNLLGECRGIPEYVASFNGANYVYGSLTSYFGTNNPLTATAWTYLTPSANGPIFGVTNTPPGGGWNMPFLSENGLTVFGWIYGQSTLSYTVNSPGWYMLSITYNPTGSGNTILYVNSNAVGSITGEYTPSGSTDYWTTYISGEKPSGVVSNYNSMLANVQTYNATLSQNDIQYLYHEGIGGAPSDLQNLVDWWPLNGNANDSSGNGNNGVPTNVIYTNTWINSYTPP